MVNLAGSHSFLRNSVNKRFFLVDNAQAFCLQAGQLQFYSGYSPFPGGPPSSGGDIVAGNTSSPGTIFSISAGTEDRNTVVSIAAIFSEGGEAVELNQAIMVRNVP